MTIPLLLILALPVLLVGPWLLGETRWSRESQGYVERLKERTQQALRDGDGSWEEEGLPKPVQRYFDTVLGPQQAVISGAVLHHSGDLNISQSAPRWRPFGSVQHVTTNPPGFVWDASVRLGPGVNIYVRDSLIYGMGALAASLLGLVQLTTAPSSHALGEGELMRYLAEGPWYPTSLLPSENLRWRALDANCAEATLRFGDYEVSLKFHFDEWGLMESATSPIRPRMIEDSFVPTPWETRMSDYERHDGMLIPMAGQVSWVVQGQRQTYWRGRIQAVQYTYDSTAVG